MNKREVAEMIKEVVGSKTYSVWADMLKRLVPGGRTHRLSIIAAGMLQVAYEIARQKEGSNTKAKKLVEVVENTFEGDEEELTGLAEELFRDAGVNFRRTNRQGQGYSIAEDAVQQYLHWDDMPWE